MDADDLFRLFERASGAPLPAGDRAQATVERLGPVLAKAARGDYLTPPDQAALITGLYALAAARCSAVLPAFLQILRLSEYELEATLGALYSDDIPPLLFGLYDGDPRDLEDLLASDDVDESVQWALFETFAWLAHAGRVPRERVVALLDRFDREPMAEPSSLAWGGWQEAILILGLVEYEPRVRAGWEAGRLPFDRQIDRDDWLERLGEARADPDAYLRSMRLLPLDDPEHDIERLRELIPDETPGPDSELSIEELRWLAGFLASRHWPGAVANIDEIDGFFTGQASGPSPPPFADAVKALWTDAGEESPPDWADAEQEACVLGLLERQWRSRRAELDADRAITPVLWLYDPDAEGQSWASGFATAVLEQREAWEPALQDEDVGPLLSAIIRLAIHKPARTRRGRNERQQMLDLLPGMVRVIHAFWHAPERIIRRAAPARSAKIGRNDPCPCGSGRKYKKCCGAASPVAGSPVSSAP
jgi:uncharacterized protein